VKTPLTKEPKSHVKKGMFLFAWKMEESPDQLGKIKKQVIE